MAGETVLILDDRAENLAFLRDYILEPNNYTVLTADNGVDGLNIALEQPIDLIISDIMMPKMGGLELLENLHEAGNPIPIILTTFYGSEETAVSAFRLGAKDYIMKPFTVEEMLAAINRALSEIRLRRERDQLIENLLKTNRLLESRVKESHALNAISRSMTSLLDLEQILNRIVEAAIYLSQAEEGSILLLDETGDLYLRAARGVGDEKVRGLKVKVHDSIAGQVVKTGEPIIVGGQSDDDSFKFATSYFVKSMVNVPLKYGRQVIGVLVVNSKERALTFKKRQVGLLMTLADYASIAIENARLHAQQQHQSQAKAAAATSIERQIAQPAAHSEIAAALRNLVSGIVQEFEGPTQQIQEWAKIIQKAPDQTDWVRYAQQIEAESRRCRRHLQNLVDYVGKEPEKKAIDLNRLLDRAWRKIEADPNFNPDVEVIRGYDPQLPPVSADPDQLEKALYYLLQNSLSAMPYSGTLRMITRRVQNDVQVLINNSGQDKSVAEAQVISDPFYKNTNPAFGLDMSISYSIVERHNGAIEVDNKAGNGTTITLRLPLDRAK